MANKVEVKSQATEYSFLVGMGKALKNTAVTILPPIAVVVVNNYQDWMPESWYPVAVPMISIFSYLIKNYVKFKKENL